MPPFNVPRHAAQIIAAIEAVGFEAYLVGGCVRDTLLGRAPSDWDIASSAPPQEIMRIFKKTVPTGLKFGTVTVICDGGNAEVTTFRSEAGYTDFRRPSEIRFCGDIKTDLSRRDFTVNAMAYHPARGLLDPFSGRKDLENRIVRAVGNPSLRFEEDALRILRAFRFAAQLGFEVEAETGKAARDKACLVSNISGERIKSELDRIFMSERPEMSLALASTGALSYLGLEKIADEKNCFRFLPLGLPERWTAFFYFYRPCNAKAIMGKLHFDVQTRENVLRLLFELERDLPAGAIEIKKRLSSGFTPDQYKMYLELRSALTGCDVSDTIHTLFDIEKHGEPYSLKMLEINGGDIINLGVKPGPMLGNILEMLLDAVINAPSLNDKMSLIDLAKQYLRVN
jgi:tRNA nucleotidyltransferase (CCA-adding enzyme)